MSERQGGCMCGAVRFRMAQAPATFGACHCEMCRRWTGSAFLATTVAEDALSWEGEAQIRTLQSSDWAERAWCKRCGSILYFRFTDGPRAQDGTIDLSIGLFDDLSGMEFTSEIYIDHKPAAYAYAGERKRLTRNEALARFGLPGDAQ